MIGWSAAERRWRDALLAALIPGDPEAGLPGLASLDLRAFWRLFAASAPPLLRLGLRVSVWILTFLPILLLGRLRLFPYLTPKEQDRVLVWAASTRLFLLRQMTLTLKMIACYAYFHDPAIRLRIDRRSLP